MNTMAELSKQRQQKLQIINRKTPLFFSNEIIGGDLPWDKQEEIMESVWQNEKTVVRSGHGLGKTWTAARLAISFLHIFIPSKVITTAPTARQVEELLWTEIGKQHRNSKMPLLGKVLETKIKIQEEWFATGFTTRKDTLKDDVNRFQGYHSPHILVVFDEGAGILPQIYDAAEGLMTSRFVRWLVIGNPGSPSGRFFEINKDPKWNKIHLSCLDSPNIRVYGHFNNTQEDLERLKELYYKNPQAVVNPNLVTARWIIDRYESWGYRNSLFQAKVLGEFPEEGTDTLIPLSWIEKAEKRIGNDNGQMVLAVDVARFGDNDSTFTILKGSKQIHLEGVHGKDTMEIAGKTRALFKQYHPHLVVIDDIGVGGGVLDRVNEQGTGAWGFNSGSASSKEEFSNLRAEAWWDLRDALGPKGDLALMPHARQSSELSSVKYKYTSKGKVQIESKDEMRKRGLSSPDYGDVIMMANWGRKRLASVQIRQKLLKDYDRVTKDFTPRVATMGNMDW